MLNRSSACAVEPLAPRSRVLISSTSSDAHTWNLVFLQLLVGEHGNEVHNRGACVPVELLVRECTRRSPELVVLSSVNGHGARDGVAAARAIRCVPALASLRVVFGGKLTTDGSLAPAERRALNDAGVDAVFTGPSAAEEFRRILAPAHADAAAA